MTDTAVTMGDLYPAGRGYHSAHEPYISSVAAALEAAGFPVESWHADPNDPRDGNIALDMGRQGTIDGHPIWGHDEVHVGWQEERGWFLLTIDEREPVQHDDGRWHTDSRFVYDLGRETVASPCSVVLSVAEKAGLTLELDDDGHPDADFPNHRQADDDEDVAFELALRHYAEVTA